MPSTTRNDEFESMNKQELRIYFKDLLLKNQDKLNSDLIKTNAIDKIGELLGKLKVKTVGIYYPLKYEADLLKIVKLHSEMKFFLPKIIDNEIKYCAYNYEDKLTLGSFKTLEPTNDDFCKPELIIVPGLAFSLDGYRLGYGKGHFDRYINNNKNILTIGICLKEQLIDNFSHEPHDQKLDFIISV